MPAVLVMVQFIILHHPLMEVEVVTEVEVLTIHQLMCLVETMVEVLADRVPVLLMPAIDQGKEPFALYGLVIKDSSLLHVQLMNNIRGKL